MKVLDNFLSESYFKEIKKTLTSNYFNWYYINNIVDQKKVDLSKRFGFAHDFVNINDNVVEFNQSNFTYFLKSFFLKISDCTEKKQIIRARAVMTNNVGESITYNKHVDFDFPHTTAILYINETDGNTLVFDNEMIIKEVEPKENRLFIFDGSLKHTSSTPTKTNERIIINTNFR